MAKFSVSIKKDAIFSMDINLSDKKWAFLNIDELPVFKIEELKRPCQAYPSGIFPGGEDSNNGRQTFKIQKFQNYIEFSKIISDEVVTISGNTYLTTKFYDNRNLGWKSDKLIKKFGEVVGYCLNGDVHNAKNWDSIEETIYKVVYFPLVEKTPAVEQLKEYLKNGICLVLFNGDVTLMKYLSEFLISSVSNVK